MINSPSDDFSLLLKGVAFAVANVFRKSQHCALVDILIVFSRQTVMLAPVVVTPAKSDVAKTFPDSRQSSALLGVIAIL